jgi:two-component system, LytTR family, sensor kinase
MAVYSIGEFLAHPETKYSRMLNSVFAISYVAVVNAFLFEVALPQFKTGILNILKGSMFLLAGLTLLSFGFYGWRAFWVYVGVYTSYTNEDTLLKGVALHSQFSIASLFFFGIVRFGYNYYQLKMAAVQLRLEKQEAELNYLKSQTNPHFLFNTLNNIYSLSLDKSDLAPESILRLSKILRFMLYDAGGSHILVEQELKIINDYIALEKLRYDNSLRLDFIQEIDDRNQRIPPLLLIPLVENAFKHGVSETRNQPFIEIEIRLKNQDLFFEVRNSVEFSVDQNAIKENIGLSNLRRQLALLYTSYELTVARGEGIFTSTLKINLNSNVKN